MMPWHDMGLFKYSVKRRIVVADAFGTVSVSMPNMLSLHGRRKIQLGGWKLTHFGQLGCEICTSLIFTCLDSHLMRGVPDVEVFDARSKALGVYRIPCTESDNVFLAI